ncbi:MAG: tetratricopeptide repeat protein [Bacteroidia bacterium]
MSEEQAAKSSAEVSEAANPLKALWRRFQERRWLSYATLAVVIVVVGVLSYWQYLRSQNEECLREMRFAESYFRQDSFEKALAGTATAMGFAQLVEAYPHTEAGNLCRLYAGLCYLRLNKPEAAVEMLAKYDAPDSYLGGIALGALAGAYAELREFKKAARYYEKAARLHRNSQTSPLYLIHAGLCYELAEEWEKAAKMYEEITHKYPMAMEFSTAQKHLARVRTRHAH